MADVGRHLPRIIAERDAAVARVLAAEQKLDHLVKLFTQAQEEARKQWFCADNALAESSRLRAAIRGDVADLRLALDATDWSTTRTDVLIVADRLLWRVQQIEVAAASPPETLVRPWHEFDEDTDDLSMCRCGIPGLTHERVYPLAASPGETE